MKNKLQTYITVSLTLTAFLFPFNSLAQPVIPPYAQPGAVMNHYMQYQMMQQRAPWTMSPTTRPEELEPKEIEVVIDPEVIQPRSSTQGVLKLPDGTVYITGGESVDEDDEFEKTTKQEDFIEQVEENF